MAIVYYPSRPQRAIAPAIDHIMDTPKTTLSQGTFDLNGGALEEFISYRADWQVNSIALSFSAAVSKDYAISIANGRIVLDRENDYLWFITDTSYPTKITLDEGFYDGDALAVELKTQLDAAFSPLTFTVDYDSTTASKYTIVPSAGTIKYIDKNLQANADKQSIAGHLFGFLSDSAFTASLASDTAVPALNQVVEIAAATGDSALAVSDTTTHIMDIDQAIKLDATTCACIADWTVSYEARV